MLAKLFNSEIHTDEAIRFINSILPAATSKVAIYKKLQTRWILSMGEFLVMWPETQESLRAALFIRSHGPGWVWPEWVKPYL